MKSLLHSPADPPHRRFPLDEPDRTPYPAQHLSRKDCPCPTPAFDARPRLIALTLSSWAISQRVASCPGSGAILPNPGNPGSKWGASVSAPCPNSAAITPIGTWPSCKAEPSARSSASALLRRLRPWTGPRCPTSCAHWQRWSIWLRAAGCCRPFRCSPNSAGKGWHARCCCRPKWSQKPAAPQESCCRSKRSTRPPANATSAWATVNGPADPMCPFPARATAATGS